MQRTIHKWHNFHCSMIITRIVHRRSSVPFALVVYQEGAGGLHQPHIQLNTVQSNVYARARVCACVRLCVCVGAVCVCACACVRACVCDAQIFQIMLKRRGSTSQTYYDVCVCVCV